jgi:cell division protein FtsB
MAKNRKNQAAAIRFGPALKASFLCLLIGGSAVGYVWQKNEIYRLGQQIHQHEAKLKKLQDANRELGNQISFLHSPLVLDQRAKELQLAPATPAQVVRLTEMPAPMNESSPRQFAQRPVADLTP